MPHPCPRRRQLERGLAYFADRLLAEGSGLTRSARWRSTTPPAWGRRLTPGPAQTPLRRRPSRPRPAATAAERGAHALSDICGRREVSYPGVTAACWADILLDPRHRARAGPGASHGRRPAGHDHERSAMPYVQVSDVTLH